MIETELFAAGQGGYRRYRIPALVAVNSGTILAFCEGRRHTGRDDDEIDILLRRSHDGGSSWEEPVVVVSDGDRTCGNPCPVVERDSGDVLLPFCVDNQRVFVTRSRDDGVTWEAPAELTAGVKAEGHTYLGTGPGHGIQLRSGRLLIPSWADLSPAPATWRDPPPNWGQVQLSFAIFSDDGGHSWDAGAPMEVDASDECGAVELEDGSLYMNMRSRGRRRQRASARSSDGGATWSPVEFHPELPEPSCQGSIASLDASHILLCHPSSTEARALLTVRLSSDGGHTWPAARVLCPGAAAYSDLTVGEGGILCAYEKDEHERLVVARFTRDWIAPA